MALYPGLVVLLLLVAGVLVAARSYPAYAFLGAVGLVAFEGTIKIALSVENVPSPLGVGAAAIDLALVVSFAALVAGPARARVLSLWSGAGRVEQAALGLLAAWVAISLVQVPWGGDPVAGLQGFRLSQGYVVIGLLAGALLSGSASGERLTRLALIGFALVAGYAALRVAIGPSGSEKEFALVPGNPQEVGTTFRAIGSFSGTFGMVSFLVPAAAVGFALAATKRPARGLGAAVCLLAIVAIAGSQVRAGLLAVAAALATIVVLLLFDKSVGRRAKLLTAATSLAVALALVGGLALTSRSSKEARRHTAGIAAPGSDTSLRLRVETWRRTLDQVRGQPFGAGLGTVGRATGRGGQAVYTDSSYLKILREQGIEGFLPFLGGLLLLIGVLVVALVRAGPSSHPVALAAVAAGTGFLALFAFAEYVEQPGKILLWTLLGSALWDLRRH